MSFDLSIVQDYSKFLCNKQNKSILFWFKVSIFYSCLYIQTFAFQDTNYKSNYIMQLS